MLLERGARINARNKYGNTLLHVAAMNGHTEMVLFLLDKGIKLTTKNNAGSTPLHYAGTQERQKKKKKITTAPAHKTSLFPSICTC
jgi:ankyrin repeat protein